MAGCELSIICREGDQPVVLRIVGDEKSAPVIEPIDAADFGEAAHQIREGCSYEYQVTDGFMLEATDFIVQSGYSGAY